MPEIRNVCNINPVDTTELTPHVCDVCDLPRATVRLDAVVIGGTRVRLDPPQYRHRGCRFEGDAE